LLTGQRKDGQRQKVMTRKKELKKREKDNEGNRKTECGFFQTKKIFL
jgi:hypothetical protein